MIIRVASKSQTNAVAGSISGAVRESGHTTVQAIGAAAVNVAIKAIIIASGHLAAEGKTIATRPSFQEVMIEDASRTAIRFEVTLT